MINKDGVLATIALATELAECGHIVSARPNTVVSELVTLTNKNMLDICQNSAVTADGQPSGDEDFVGFASIVETVTSGTLENPSLHDRYLDGVKNDISKAVAGHISFARNVVKPIVVEYAESVTAYLNNNKMPTAADMFNVEVLDLPELMEDPVFMNTLNFYQDKPVIAPDAIPAFGQKSAEELLELLKFGEQGADEAVVAWYSRKGGDFFVNVWENFFRNRKESNPMRFLSYDDVTRMDHFERLDVCLAMYLLANKLFEEIDDSMKNLTLNAYQNIMAQTRDFAACSLTEAVKRLDGLRAGDIMVLSADQNRCAIRVYGQIYRQWLEGGGDVNALLGLVITGKRLVTSHAVKEQQLDLLNAWQTHTVIYNAAESNRRFDMFKSALSAKFAELMGGMSQEELAAVEATPEYFARVKKVFEAELDSLKLDDMNDMFGVAVKLICRARFFYTSAEKILTGIINASKENPNLDIREAALLSTIDYVIDYAADQLSITANA